MQLAPGEEAIIPTGIRAEIAPEYVLKIYPRSSMGIKKGLFLLNTVGIIDGDYAFADNEGHIFIAIRNVKCQKLHIKAGERFAQGLFIPCGVAKQDFCKRVPFCWIYILYPWNTSGSAYWVFRWEIIFFRWEA